MARIGTGLLAATALASAGGAALGAWLASEKLNAQQLKTAIALALIAVALKTAWGLL